MSDEQTTQEIEDPFVMPLLKPITFGKVDYTEITLTEPTVGQVEEAGKKLNPDSVNVALVSMVAKIPEGAVRAMHIRDFNAAGKYLKNFTTGGQVTGGM